eukprot:Opistho-1_new@90685
MADTEPLLGATDQEYTGPINVMADDSVPPVRISVTNLSYAIDGKDILKDITCELRPGRLVALMGPSGAGKTTLLNVLCGRARGTVEGQLLVNGTVLDPRKFKMIFNMIPQDDVLFSALTPRETLTYTAELRLPSDMPAWEKKARVDGLINDLYITRCADTIIGDENTRGISGGQRKRVSIAMELITNPSILFVDEPTSGLDSTTALEVVQILRKLADGGRNVICTIHQPSYDCFKQFHDLLLLARGEVVYFGEVPEMVNYFGRFGMKCPEFGNPIEYIMDQVEKPLEDGRTLARAWYDIKSAGEAPRLLRRGSSVANVGIGDYDYPNTLAHQTWTLTKRATWMTIKDAGQFNVRLGSSIVIGLLIGLTYLQQDSDQGSYQDRIAVMFMSVFFLMMNSLMSTVVFFPLERAVMFREYGNGSYRFVAYFISRVFVICVFQLLFSLSYCVVVYWMVGLKDTVDAFVVYCAVCCAMGLIGCSLGVAVGAWVPNIHFAQTLLPPILFPLQLFSGYLIRPTNIPVYFKWIYYLSFFQYAFQLVIVNEFDGFEFEFCNRTLEICPLGDGYQTGAVVLYTLDYDKHDFGQNFGILAGFFVFFIAASFLLMRHSAHKKRT